MENLLTTKQVAKRLGVSDARVRQMILNNQLPAQKFGHINMVKESDVEQIGERKAGRPRKPKTKDENE